MESLSPKLQSSITGDLRTGFFQKSRRFCYNFEHQFLMNATDYELVVCTKLKANLLVLYGFMHGHAHVSREMRRGANHGRAIRIYEEMRKVSTSLRDCILGLRTLRDVVYMG